MDGTHLPVEKRLSSMSRMAASHPIADFSRSLQGRAVLRALAIIVFAVTTFVGGWLASSITIGDRCPSTAHGYATLNVDTRKLEELPWRLVSTEALGEIQKCWAAHPYQGPQYSLDFFKVVKAPTGGVYVLAYPSGITDTELVFLVDAHGQLSKAFVVGTL